MVINAIFNKPFSNESMKFLIGLNKKLRGNE